MSAQPGREVGEDWDYSGGAALDPTCRICGSKVGLGYTRQHADFHRALARLGAAPSDAPAGADDGRFFSLGARR